MKVAVGSKNPVKIKSVQLAFEQVWPGEKFEFIGVDVDSGISNQPMSDNECILGAKNRAKNAIKIADADFGVGLEGGIQKHNENYFSVGWVCVVDKNNNEGIGSGVKTMIVPAIAKMVEGGMELGVADDIFFKKHDSKQGDGYVGIMTNNAISRVEGFKHGVICALARFIKFDLFI